MGTTYISAPPTASLFVFSDDFNRANGALGSNWTSGAGGPTIDSNSAIGGVGVSVATLVSTGVHTFAANQYVQFTPTTYTASGFGTKNYTLWLRQTNVRMAWVAYDTGSYSEILAYNSDDFNTGVVPTINSVIRVEAVGTALTIKINGSSVWTGVSTRTPAAGQPGFSADYSLRVENFEAGEL